MHLIDSFQGNKYYWEYYEDDDINAQYLFAYDSKTNKQLEDLRDGNAQMVYRLLVKYALNKFEIDNLVHNKYELQLPAPEEIEEMVQEHENL